MRRFFAPAAVVVLLASAGAVWAMWSGGESGKVEIVTAEATRGTVRRVVATTGKIHALLTVEISSQLSGQIAEINADYNSKVSRGQVIARIDPRTFEARLREAEAGLAVAKAGLALQEAAVGRSDANLRKAKRDYDRALALQARGAVSQAALDAALAAFDGARADLEVAKAQVLNAEALVTQRQAALDSARVDLERTYLRSPVDGIVIDRVAEVGLTVAASFQAPKLFTIAEDLERIRIEAQVDEAEIGDVAVGNPATFAVDTYEDVTFTGTVNQIRLQPTEQQNVVTYTVVIGADNPAGKLLPGMTANVSIVTGERHDTLVVPNEALRFQPRGKALALVRARERPATEERRDVRVGTVWVATDDGRLEQRRVDIGLSDDKVTEILGGLAETQKVVIRAREKPGES